MITVRVHYPSQPTELIPSPRYVIHLADSHGHREKFRKARKLIQGSWRLPPPAGEHNHMDPGFTTQRTQR
jgi:hypothetical protein